MLEVRSTGELRSDGKKLSGYAAIFNSEAILGDFVEVIRNGAFRTTLESGSNVRALYHHQGDALLGTTRAGTLQLREDGKGLAFDLQLPDTTHGRDLAVLVGRGDVSGCSFGFKVREGGDSWQQRGAQLVRELRDVELVEITLTADPAYADTSVALRSRPATAPPDLARLWLETVS